MKLSTKILLISTIMLHSTILSALDSVQAIVLAAGQGSRLKTGITKMITPICGKPMVLYPIHLLESMNIPVTAVIGFQKEAVKTAIDQAQVKNVLFVEQTEQLGTGHALRASKNTWHADTILVLNGDMPLIDATTINTLLTEHAQQKAAITIATSYCVDPANTYGRIVHENGIVKVVEKKHFTHAITDYPDVNVGVYVIDRAFLEQYGQEVEQNYLTHEFYITDLVEIASKHQLNVVTVSLPFDQFYGVNTFQELATVEEKKQAELVHYWMAQGVRFINPRTVYLDHTVTIGRGTVIYPGVQLLQGACIGEFCTLMPHAVIMHSHIQSNTTIDAHSVIIDSLQQTGCSVTANDKHRSHLYKQ